MGSQVGVVTGGTGALGEAVVRCLAGENRRLVVPWVSETDVSRFQKSLGSVTARISLHRADLTQEADVERMFVEVAQTHGRLDFVINLAGGFTAGPLESLSASSWHHMIDINATTAFLCCRHAVPIMRRAARGRIVNVASGPALSHGASGMSAYAAAKAAVLNLTESLAKELVASGITVNALVPSVIDTPANRGAMPNADRSKWLQPEEIARVVEWLVSDDAQIVTGTAVCLSKS